MTGDIGVADDAELTNEGPDEGGSAAPASDTSVGDKSEVQPEQVSPGAVAAAPPLPPAMFTDRKKSCGSAPGVGDKAKDFSLKTPGGKDIVLARYRKRVVLLNFWGTWCKPCLKELPEFDRLYRRYRKHGLTLIAVATDEDARQVQAFVKQRKLSAKVAIGGQALADAYGSPKFPFTFVIDTKGVIQAAYRGYEAGCLGTLEQDIRRELEKLR
jgi:peroxiredoxin